MEISFEKVVEISRGVPAFWRQEKFEDCPHYYEGRCFVGRKGVGVICNYGAQRNVADSFRECGRYLVRELGKWFD